MEKLETKEELLKVVEKDLNSLNEQAVQLVLTMCRTLYTRGYNDGLDFIEKKLP